MSNQEIVERRYPDADCVEKEQSGSIRCRIRVGWTWNGKPIYAGKWCSSEERAWEAAARSITTKSLNRMDE